MRILYNISNHSSSRRSETLLCYNKGEKIEASGAMLASMGIIPCTVEEVRAAIPPLNTALSIALSKLRKEDQEL